MYIPQEGVSNRHLVKVENPEWARIVQQVTLGQVRIGPEAARAIAERVEGEHGFWDFEERKQKASA